LGFVITGFQGGHRETLFYALGSALRELAMRGAEGSESYIVGRKELESAREKLGIKRF